MKCVKLEKNKLPRNINVINHYYCLCKSDRECRPEFLNKMPGFNDLRNETVNDGIYIWQAGSFYFLNHMIAAWVFYLSEAYAPCKMTLT